MPLSYAQCDPLLQRGFTHRAIAESLGVSIHAVSQCIRRHKLKVKAQQFAEVVVNANPSDRARCFVELMATDVNESFDRIRLRNPPETNPDELERENVLEKLNKRARLTYGLDNDTSKSVVVGISVRLGTDVRPVRIEQPAAPTPVDISTATEPVDPSKP